MSLPVMSPCADGVAVVLSTRVPQGPVAGVYGDGGGADDVGAKRGSDWGQTCV